MEQKITPTKNLKQLYDLLPPSPQGTPTITTSPERHRHGRTHPLKRSAGLRTDNHPTTTTEPGANPQDNLGRKPKTDEQNV